MQDRALEIMTINRLFRVFSIHSVLIFHLVMSYRILLVPVQMQSHASCMSTIALTLAARGHHVHMLFAKGYRTPMEIQAGSNSPVTIELYERPALETEDRAIEIDEMYDNITRMILEERASALAVQRYTGPLLAAECRRLLLHNELILTRLGSLNFDIAVVDGLLFVKCLYLVPHRLGIPWISMTDTFEPWLARAPWLPSFVPSLLGTLTEKMTFAERLENTLANIALLTIPLIPNLPEDIVIKYQTYGHFDSLDDLAARSLFWILTSDTNIDYARPTMPNMIEAGGLTAKPSTGILSPEVSAFIGNSSKGIIVVSFGSIASQFPTVISQKFISAFLQLKDYHIIWRFENVNNVEIPGNVLALKWIPQNELLGHPTTRIFITHCGNNGQYESLYHGVPMIGFPLNGDQPYNAKRMAYKGYGLAMDIQEFTSEELLSNIYTILSDENYKKKIAKASEIYKSSPQKPGEKAVWWIEHVTKFGGSHLRSAGSDLPLYQYLLLDVLAVFVSFVLLIVMCVSKVFKIFLRKALPKKETQQKKKVS